MEMVIIIRRKPDLLEQYALQNYRTSIYKLHDKLFAQE